MHPLGWLEQSSRSAHDLQSIGRPWRCRSHPIPSIVPTMVETRGYWLSQLDVPLCQCSRKCEHQYCQPYTTRHWPILWKLIHSASSSAGSLLRLNHNKHDCGGLFFLQALSRKHDFTCTSLRLDWLHLYFIILQPTNCASVRNLNLHPDHDQRRDLTTKNHTKIINGSHTSSYFPGPINLRSDSNYNWGHTICDQHPEPPSLCQSRSEQRSVVHRASHGPNNAPDICWAMRSLSKRFF